MDYVQGTIVKLTYTVQNFDTGANEDPPDTSVTVVDRTGTTVTLSYSTSEIQRLAQGKYRAPIDTSALIGGCEYEVMIFGSNEVRKRGFFYVTPKIGP